ncbi:hypothetical protein NIES4071_85710 [Calothrix sp. NIES-4071]|nr:hypothetical protein NIES4071_85710 [Calothrix sp. NIES-4071]BAZ62838.1 hypothetical protein NIES4105_85640 [Calothrix sp. NIES-4105]
MRERVGQSKKATTENFSISTLKQPTRGFGLESPHVMPKVITEQQAVQKPLSYDFSRISMRPQAKLTINKPGDVYEQEADNVAQQVMQRMSKSAGQEKLQRQLAPQKEETKNIPVTSNSSIHVQAAPEAAYVTDTAHFHKQDTKVTGSVVVNGKAAGRIGKKLKTGDTIFVDPSQVIDNTWYEAKAGNQKGYIRKHKVVLLSSLKQNSSSPTGDSKKLEQVGGLSDGVGGASDKVANGLENAYIKSNQEGLLKDIADDKDPMTSAETGKAGVSIAAGAGDSVTGILGMIGSAQQISRQNNRWQNLENGFGFVESTSKAVSGSTKTVDSFAKALGEKKGTGKSDTVEKYTSAVADGLSSVKSTALGVIGLYKLYKHQSSEKPKDALVTFKQLVEAAHGAAKVAKSAYDIIGNGIPMSVVYTIPALSIAVSTINCLIRLADALKAGQQKEDMGGEADSLRTELATIFGVPVPDESKDSGLFDKTRRGTFPAYKTYHRVKAQIRQTLDTAIQKGDGRLSNVTNASGKQQRLSEINAACTEIDDTIEKGINDNEIKDKVKNKLGAYTQRVTGLRKRVEKLKDFKEKIDRYEFVDKMSEINQKRKVSGWTDVAMELVNLSGDIVTISTGATGVGAIVGQAMKAGAGGAKLAHSGAKFTQQMYRDRGKGSSEKSTSTKHKEYVAHTKFIFSQIAALNANDQNVMQKAKKIDGYIKATGVNKAMFYALSKSPDQQVEMMVEAMKRR